MFYYELKKIINKRNIIILLAIMALYALLLILGSDIDSKQINKNEAGLEYFRETVGVREPVSEAKLEEIESKLNSIHRSYFSDFMNTKYFNSKWGALDLARSSARINIERYDKVKRSLKKDNGILKEFYEQDSSNELYDTTGADKFLDFFNYIWPAYICIILLIVESMCEDEKMKILTGSCRYTYKDIRKHKEIVLMLMSVAVLSIFFLISYRAAGFVFGTYKYLDYPLYMVTGYVECASGLSISSIIMLQFVLNLMICLLLAEVIILITSIFKKKSIAIAVSVIFLIAVHAMDILSMTVYNNDYTTDTFRLMSEVTFNSYYEIEKMFNVFSLINIKAFFNHPQFYLLGNLLIENWLVSIALIFGYITVIHIVCEKLKFRDTAKESEKVNTVIKTHSLIGYEVKKVCTKTYLVGIAIILTFFCIVDIGMMVGVKNGDETRTLKELYKEYGGEITAEKVEALEKLKLDVEETISKDAEYSEKFIKNEIDSTEYQKYREHLYDCKNIEKAVKLIYEHMNLSIDNSEYLVFENYYNKMIDYRNFPLNLLFALIFSMAFVIIHEKKNLKMVVHVTAKSEKGIITNKVIAYAIVGCITAAIAVFVKFLTLLVFQRNLQFGIKASDLSFLTNVPDAISLIGWIVGYYALIVVITALLYSLLSFIVANLYLKRSYFDK